MRIAFFSETFLPHTDGIVTRLCHTLSHLQSKHADHLLVVAPQLPGAQTSYQGIPVLRVPSFSLPFYPDFYLGLPLLNERIRAVLDTFRPDIIQAVNPVGGIGHLALRYAERQGVPLVASFNTDLPYYASYYGFSVFEPLLWSYLRWIHNRATLNLCPSKPVQERLQAHGIQRVTLWRSGIDAGQFHPQWRSQAWRERLTNGNPDATILLYVGRVASEKRIDRIIKALPQLPGCHLAIVGNGPAMLHLQHLAECQPVTFLGTLKGKDLAAAYASADIFALASITETFGFVTLEALASGLPVVAAKQGGTLDLVLDGHNGLLFEPDSTEDMVTALRCLVESPDKRHSMGQAARQFVEDGAWTWEAATDDLRAHYTELVQAAATSTQIGIAV